MFTNPEAVLEEVQKKSFPFFVALDFRRCPELATEDGIGQERHDFRMFFLQFIDLPVHFHFHQKVDDGPHSFSQKAAKSFFIRTLNRQQHLRPGIHVTRELHFGLRILVRSNIHLYDVPKMFNT